MTFSNQI